MTDILLDDVFDLAEDAVTGDWIEFTSDLQHQELIILLGKGSIKENPDCTVGAEDYLNGTELDSLLSEVRTKLIGDGMVLNNISLDETTFDIVTDAKYNR